MLLIISGCSAETNTSSDKMKIYASFYPMYDFVKQVGGDKVEVINMTPEGIEPHDFEPTMDDIKNLSNADMFVYNGNEMEHWVEDVLSSLDNDKLVVVETSENVEKQEDGEHLDPHTWLSIKNAKIQLKSIYDALATLDEKNKDYYEENYNKYLTELNVLDEKFASELAPYEGESIIVAHQAFGYLSSDYHLKQVAIEGLSPDSEPDPSRMARIVDFAKEQDVKVIFFEELVDPKVAESIAKEIGAETKVLNTLEGLSDKEMKEGKNYLTMMEENLRNILYALSK